jgi:hypothetical protein
MEHPPYNLDLAACDLFLFGAMKEDFSRRRLDNLDGPFIAVNTFLGGVSAVILQMVFQECV